MTPFTPPTPQQVRDLLEQHPAHAPPPWTVLWPWAVVLGATVLAMVVRDPLLSVLPWLALTWAIGWQMWRRRVFRKFDEQAQKVQEAAALRQSVHALREAWRLLPRLTSSLPLYGTTVAVMGDCLDRLRCYESAIVIYDHLIDRLPDDNSDAALIRIRRAMAELQTDQTLDADDTLRRLRGVIESGRHGDTVTAMYRLAMLVQQVHTHHYAEAVEGARRMIRTLRPLGALAGYGYALIGAAHHHTADTRRAAWWWCQASRLIPAVDLIQRFPALGVMAESYTPDPKPAPTPRARPVS